MEEGKIILKQRIDTLPTELKNYLKSGDFSKQLDFLLKSHELEDWQKTSIENELILVLIGLEPFTNLGTNISKEAKIQDINSESIAKEIIDEILTPISEKVYAEIEQQNEYKKNSVPKSNPLGKSFEETILNQARGMMPAREEGGQDPEVSEQIGVGIPGNLPTEENQNSKPNIHTSNYGGNDPYREPIE